MLGTLAFGLGLPALLFGAVLVLSPVTKPAMIDAFIRVVLGHDPATFPFRNLIYAVAIAVLALILVTFGAVASGMTVWWEMRVSSRMQSRVGCNRVGAGGFFQWVADAVKLSSRRTSSRDRQAALPLGAYFVLTGFALTFVALPFGESLIAADLNVGIFYLVSVTALVVVGILLAGWSSNSKWALFGGMRSAAQVVSYEIPSGLAIMVPVLMAGSLSMQEIIRAQGAALAVVHLHEPRRAPRVRHLLHLPARGGQPDAVRPPRGRVRARRGLSVGVLGVPVRHLLPGRVRQPLGDGGDRGDALPRRVAGAVRRPRGVRRGARDRASRGSRGGRSSSRRWSCSP